jgi:hypothetical protein
MLAGSLSRDPAGLGVIWHLGPEVLFGLQADTGLTQNYELNSFLLGLILVAEMSPGKGSKLTFFGIVNFLAKKVYEILAHIEI